MTAREKWDSLQARWRAAHEEYRAHDIAMGVKYHSDRWHMHGWALQRERDRYEVLRRKQDRIGDQMFDMCDKLSKRQWRSGVPAHWICDKLTFDDMSRPLSERLSVEPPLAYGSVSPMQ